MYVTHTVDTQYHSPFSSIFYLEKSDYFYFYLIWKYFLHESENRIFQHPPYSLGIIIPPFSYPLLPHLSSPLSTSSLSPPPQATVPPPACLCWYSRLSLLLSMYFALIRREHRQTVLTVRARQGGCRGRETTLTVTERWDGRMLEECGGGVGSLSSSHTYVNDSK